MGRVCTRSPLTSTSLNRPGQPPAVTTSEALEVFATTGMDALYVTYGGAITGRNLEFRALVLPQERRQIVLTGTILATRAQELAPVVDRALLDVRQER